jgi:glycosyltransferase involved in cell wall biosynthesis
MFQVLSAATRVVLPRVARINAEEGVLSTRKPVLRVGATLIALTTGYWLALLFGHNLLLRWTYGQRFAIYAHLVPVIGLHLIACAFVTACDVGFNSIQSPRSSFRIKLLMVALMLPINTALMWRFGLVGAVIGIPSLSAMTAACLGLKLRRVWQDSRALPQEDSSQMSSSFAAGASNSGRSEQLVNAREVWPSGEAVPDVRGTVLVWCSNVEPGGMERIVLSVANGLVGKGWRVILVGPFSRVPFLQRLIRPEILSIDHQIQKSPRGLLRTGHFLENLVRQYGVNVISAHGSVFPLMLNSAPVVWTEHDVRYGGREMLRGLRGFAWRHVRNLVERGSWRMVTVSRFVQKEVCKKLELLDNRVAVIYNGLPNAAELYRLPAPDFRPPYRIGFLGRLTESKYPLEVFTLSKLLNGMGIPHVWKVFGDGGLRPAMQEALRTLGHSVQLCGVAEKPEDAFRQIDLLCFHARGEQEGLGMVLIEALAAGRSIVAWDAGCIREILTGRATLVSPPFSLRRFAATVAGVLLSGADPRVQDQRFSEARMISEYDVILRGSSRRSPTA